VLYGPEVYKLHEPGDGGKQLHRYPWHLALNAVEHAWAKSR